MPSWVRRVSDLLSKDTPREAPKDSRLRQAPATPDTPTAAPRGWRDLDAALFDWLLDTPPGPEHVATEPEALWLAEIDPMIVADKGKGELLPRAAGVIPPLLNSLRDEGQSASELAGRVERDPNLVAEVIRLANSIAFRGTQPVSELADAVRRVGTTGVRQAIAKVVLKPMFTAQAGALSTRAAARLWEHGQAQADLCRALAPARGVDPFEAYLGGLLYDIGWTAGLRALDRVFEQYAPPADLGFSDTFKAGFQQRRERLFAQFVAGWRLSLPLHAAARAVQAAEGFAGAADPLAQVLLDGNRLAAARVLQSHHLLADDPRERLAAEAPQVAAVYDTLA
jgi:HD-like signal output (HDOD) protein